jgi:hypothetical protein
MDPIIHILSVFFTIYYICILAWFVISWLPMVSPALAYNSFVLQARRFLDSVVLPWVRLFRFVPPIRAGAMMIDLSSMVAFLVFIIGSRMIIDILSGAS